MEQRSVSVMHLPLPLPLPPPSLIPNPICWRSILFPISFSHLSPHTTSLFSSCPSLPSPSLCFFPLHLLLSHPLPSDSPKRRATKMIPSFHNKSYEERLARLNRLPLEKRRVQGKIIECFKMINGFMNVDANKMFSIDNTWRTRSNGVKLRCKQVQLDCTKLFFTNDVVR